jgi:hypothetical protein
MEPTAPPTQNPTLRKALPLFTTQVERRILAHASRGPTIAKRMRATVLTGQPNLCNGEEDEIEHEEGYDEAPSWKRVRLTEGPFISEVAALDDSPQEQIQQVVRGFNPTFKRRKLSVFSQQAVLDNGNDIDIKQSDSFSYSVPPWRCTRPTGP